MPLFESAENIREPNVFINEHVTYIALNNVEDAGELYEFAIDWLGEQKNYTITSKLIELSLMLFYIGAGR